MPKIKEGIISLLNLHSAPDAKEISLSNRQSMMEQLKGLYSNEFLDGLNDDQIYDLFEEMIEVIDDVVDYLGSRKQIENLRKIIEDGTSADRQINEYKKNENLNDVVDKLILETMEGC